MKTYGELKTEIATWLDRTDQTANIPGYIRLAETRLYRKLRSRENEFTTTWDQDTVPAPFNPISLPQNFREAHLVTLDGLPLTQLDPQEYYQKKYSGQDSATEYFAIIERQLYLYPWAEAVEDLGTSFTIEMIYYGTESITQMAPWETATNPNTVPESDGTPAAFVERSDAATTRLFLVAPDALLFGALYYAHKLLREPTKAEEYKIMFQDAILDLENENDLAEFSGSTTGISSVYHD